MINKVILLGKLGKDPEVRTISSGKKVANFSLATNETRKDKNGDKITETEWHNIVVWGTAAETVEKYLKKGSQIFIEGKIKYKSYDDKDGNKKYITEIQSEKFQFVGGKKENSSPVSQAGGGTDEEDPLPF
jgi:single-strand DNA-binding protein